jgi:signal transduction histidine kinase
MKSIREVVETLRIYENSAKSEKEINDNKTEFKNIRDIKKLTDEFAEKAGVEIHLDINNENIAKNSFDSSNIANDPKYNLKDYNIPHNSKINTALYHILQECLTNAVRHGNATEIWVEINIKNNAINFSVKDNGVGLENIEIIKEGYGLKGIRERALAFGGTMEYCTDCTDFSDEVHKGFMVKGILYLEEIND